MYNKRNCNYSEYNYFFDNYYEKVKSSMTLT